LLTATYFLKARCVLKVLLNPNRSVSQFAVHLYNSIADMNNSFKTCKHYPSLRDPSRRLMHEQAAPPMVISSPTVEYK